MSLRILIIDDDQDLVLTLSEFLTYRGFLTTVANSGMAGLRQIRNTPPDVIICDWQMPNLTGSELLRELQLSDKTAHIPFIIMTGRDDIATDFKPTAVLIKPVSVYTLIDTIKKFTQADSA